MIKELKRDIDPELDFWFTLPSRSPLVIFGPRQVGKSTLARSFALRKFKDRTIEINFFKATSNKAEKKSLANIFNETLDPKTIIRDLSIVLQRPIDVENDILIMDEIQDCPRAYEALKHFKEDFPKLAIIATGSYLKLFLETSSELRHPLGCTTELNLYPLSFSEFLMNFHPLLYSEYQKIDVFNPANLSSTIHSELLKILDTYFYTGGMPEVVFNYINLLDKDPSLIIKETRSKQKDLIEQYKRDLQRYSKLKEAKKIESIFEKIPFYLQKHFEEPVNRFQFKELSEKANYRTLKSSFDYLKYNGLIINSIVVNNPSFPLKMMRDDNETNQFKSYFFDIGLLNAALDCPYEQIFLSEMSYYKGYVVENFVAQQLKKYIKGNELFCFKKNSRFNSAEIEFLIEKDGRIIPIEVKSSPKSTRSKSLTAYIKDYAPKLAFKCTLKNFGRGEGYTSIPLYLIEKIFTNLE